MDGALSLPSSAELSFETSFEHDLGFPDVGPLVDAKDVMCESIRLSVNLKQAMHSSKNIKNLH